MRVKVIQNRYSTDMSTLNIDIQKLLMSPLVVLNKEDVPLFNLSAILPTTKVKRANFDHIGSNYLVLDFDTGFTVNQFAEKYPKLYETIYFAYSSYNNKPEKEKYRIVIKLTQTFTDQQWRALAKMLKRAIPENDHTSYQISRFHNFPAIHPENRINYWSLGFFDSYTELNLLDYLGIDEGILALALTQTDEPDEFIPYQKSVYNFRAIDNLTVKDWIDRRWNTDGSGNGGLFHRGLFSCIGLCKRYGDTDTLRLVEQACRKVGEHRRFEQTLKNI